ncbi:hypothetical protein [Chryseobacterium oryctis]|uniref:Cytochrome C n=1 Tax=Chryseobacterium oryctis TaxID=2952618 RepID=A0ABT3HPB5_9FLAO|nr:hypothetical protein [Chryseobacterium oryctis]MCW3161627.1 hypothetical protein [Chryseobacterium oryctis]
MKKKLIYILLFVSLIINITLIYKFFYQGESVKLSSDGRTEIKMSKENRDFVMAEMRGFLESVQKINEGIAKNDPNPIASVGQQSGTCKVDVVPQGLVKSLPLGFKQMGFDTHELFDVMSKMAKEKYDRQQTQEKLNQLLNNCVACHKTYKITSE